MALDPASAFIVNAAGTAGSEAARWLRTSLSAFIGRVLGRHGAAAEGVPPVATLLRLSGETSNNPAASTQLAILVGLAQQQLTPGPASPDFPPSVHADYFTNAEKALRMLDQAAARPFAGSARGVLLLGDDGSGKTTIAARWALRGYAPLRGGPVPLYADLRHVDTSEEAQARVYRLLLRQLGMREEDMPSGVEERAWLYRGLMAHRHIIMVLDNARGLEQLKPYIISTASVFTIVTTTTRDDLRDLFQTQIPVGRLSTHDTKRLFIRLMGKRAFEQALHEHPTLVTECQGGAAVVHRTVATLRAGHNSIDGRLRAEDTYHRLQTDLARFLNLLSFLPWPDISLGAASAAGDVPQSDAARWLTQLADLQFLERQSGHEDRYSFRPSIQEYVAKTALGREGLIVKKAVVKRSLNWLLHFAARADHDAHPLRWPVNDLRERLTQTPFASSAEALNALVSEIDTITRAVAIARDVREFDTVCGLCDAMWSAQLKAGRQVEVLPALRIGVAVADKNLPDSLLAARMQTLLGLALTELGRDRWAEAKRVLRRAVRTARASGHVLSHATAVESLGLLSLRQGNGSHAFSRFEESYDILAQIGEGHPDAVHAKRARALLRRHMGSALRCQSHFSEAHAQLNTALDFFRSAGDRYNEGRTLTDIAWAHLDKYEFSEALPPIDAALALLTDEAAEPHIEQLRRLRRLCVAAQG
ncbi:ATP-binding protein [Streptomyces radicis]|uniref:ATP-binding protein n=1 Tax=Streptomyces radicis TaxID=1750517 RepID=UPI0011C3FC61|nr:ATP-binding protein [Streptomyces radicis]